MAFKDNLFALRNQANMTQEELATLCGVSRSLIAGFELGTRTANSDMIKVLAEKLGCTPNDLILGPQTQKEANADAVSS